MRAKETMLMTTGVLMLFIFGAMRLNSRRFYSFADSENDMVLPLLLRVMLSCLGACLIVRTSYQVIQSNLTQTDEPKSVDDDNGGNHPTSTKLCPTRFNH